MLVRGEILPDVVDAAINTSWVQSLGTDLRRVICECIREGRIVPTCYFYMGDSGYRSWIDLIRDPDYQYYHEAVEFYRVNASLIAERIHAELGTASVDYISLGPGDGVKDQMILRWFIDSLGGSDSGLYYYPVDTNFRMLATAALEVARIPRSLKKVRIKATIADFEGIGTLRPVYQYRSAPKVFVLLGNILGNSSDDRGLLGRLFRVMHEGDVLIVEVGTRSSLCRPNMMNAFKVFDCGPLDLLGIPYDPLSLEYEQKVMISSIPGTETMIATYPSLVVDNVAYEKIPLAYIHAYDPDGLCQAADKIGFRVVACLPEDPTTARFLVLVLAKPRSRRGG